MAKLDVFHRYLHIINLLLKRPASLEEINSYLDQQSEIEQMDFAISKRTFLRDKADILSIFHLDIQYNAAENKYQIAEDDTVDNLHLRLIEAFSTFNALRFTESIPDAVQFEARRPQGLEYYRTILQAIKMQQELVFHYCKFYEDAPQKRTVKPLLLKEYRNRWYLLAIDAQEGDTRTFGLDRMSAVQISTKKFKPLSIQPRQYFAEAFGIIKPQNESPQEVVLSFTPFQAKYIKTMPLHRTQEIIIDNETECRIKMKLYITTDFVMELISMADGVKVISPDTLIASVKKALQLAIDQY